MSACVTSPAAYSGRCGHADDRADGFKVGDVSIPNRLVMAPMAGVTDSVFRSIVFEHGAGLTTSEMVSAKSIVFGNKNTHRLLENFPHVRPCSIQFFASDPHDLSEAIKRLEAVAFDIVDINMGCPMPKIVKNGEGAALMKNPTLVAKLVRAATEASARPVTVKIRTGFCAERINCVQIARIAEESGASAVAVHGRTREQYYSGEANWEHIGLVRDAVKIPVVGNGDIKSPGDAVRRLESFPAVMIARGAMGNPWIFSDTRRFMQTGIMPAPQTKHDVIRAAKSHLARASAAGVRLFEMRKHMSWYTSGFTHAAAIRKQINQAASIEEMNETLDLALEML